MQSKKVIKYLALIPARAGSKGIPGKNLKLFAGKPLIEYTFKAALASEKIDEIHLSSDCDAAIQLAEKSKIAVLYKRPQAIASDTATAIDVILYHLEWLRKEANTEVENIVYLQPTNPIRFKGLIDKAILQYENDGAHSLIAVCECSQHPNELVYIEKGKLKMLIDQRETKNRQNYKPYYFITGGLYIFKSVFVERSLKTFSETSSVIVTSKEEGVDIDDLSNFYYAETLYNLNQDKL